MKVKFHLLNLTVLSIVHNISIYGKEADCELARRWIYDGDCCVSNSSPYICNANNKIVSINLNNVEISLYYTPIFEELTFLQVKDKRNDPVELIGINISVFNQPKLKTLIVDVNYVDSIATNINPNCSLEELTLNNTKIENLPNSIFKLNNLKKIELGNNSSMNVKIVKFKNSPIECNFENTNIDCYQDGACSNISSNNYKKCTDDEIKEIIGNENEDIKIIETPDGQSSSNNKDNSNSENNNKNNNLRILLGITIGIGIIILIILVNIIKKVNKKNKLNNYIDFNLYKRRKPSNEVSNSANNETTIIDNSNDNTNNGNQIKIKNNNGNMDNNIKNNDDYLIKKIMNNNDYNKILKINNPYPTVIEFVPITTIGEDSALPSYSELEYSHGVQPIGDFDIEKKLLHKKN